MKFTLAFVLTVVAAVSGSTDIESPIDYDITTSDETSLIVAPVQYNSEVDADISPVEFDLNPIPVPFEFNSPVEYIVDEGQAFARNRLLHRAQFIRSAVSNTVHIHDHTWRGAANVRISSVRAAQVGANQGATGRVTAGGVNRNFATVRLQSQRGRGFNIVLEIYGR